MVLNPVGQGKGNNSGQITSTQSKSGEEAFHDLTKSEGYNKGALEQAINERTRITRNKRADKSKKHSSLFLITNDEDEILEEAIYRTVLVDGQMFTLRLLAVA